MWEFRYYEMDAQGGRQRRTSTVGSLTDYPTESAVRKSPNLQALLLRINSEAAQPGTPAPTFGAVLARYEKEEMPERHSTSLAYRSYIETHIRPRWGDTPVSKLTARGVVGSIEKWLKSLALAPKNQRQYPQRHARGVRLCNALGNRRTWRQSYRPGPG